MSLWPQDRLQSWPPEMASIAPDWRPAVAEFLASPPGQRISQLISNRLAAHATIYPPEPFRALKLTPLHTVKVVILGQDPYHGAGQAEGLAFSVAPGIQPPPSLRNIFKELQRENIAPASPGGSLAAWARQGVLLLNTSLTVEDGSPASHAKHGWEELTDAIVIRVAETAPACAYLLWGSHAQSKAPLIEHTALSHNKRALVLKANHPSPLSALRPPAPFIGCGHFRKANDFLTLNGLSPIAWSRLS